MLGEVLLCVYPCAGSISMHLASDYIHPYKDAGGRPARCRVRIYLPDDMRDAPVVICSEVPNNPGGSVTNSAEVIIVGVIQNNKLPTPLQTAHPASMDRAPARGEHQWWSGDVRAGRLLQPRGH